MRHQHEVAVGIIVETWPLAPGMLSTMTGRPSEFVDGLAGRRAAWSVVPLAAAGATVQSD
jgi:hypothetical protein